MKNKKHRSLAAKCHHLFSTRNFQFNDAATKKRPRAQPFRLLSQKRCVYTFHVVPSGSRKSDPLKKSNSQLGATLCEIHLVRALMAVNTRYSICGALCASRRSRRAVDASLPHLETQPVALHRFDRSCPEFCERACSSARGEYKSGERKEKVKSA